MNSSDNNTSSKDSFKAKKVKSRYIVINEDIYQNLTNDALAVYMALRFDADYSIDESEVDRNIQFLCNKAKIKKTRCKECLNELEEHGLIKRLYNSGYQSTFLVAQDLGHFKTKKVKKEENTVDQPGRQTTDPGRQTTDPGRQTTDITNNLSTNSFNIKPSVDSKSTGSYRDDDLFMLFYSIYPHKQKPEVARKAFYKHKPDENFVQMLCNDIRLRMQNNWKNRHKSKIPFPSTYLNGKEWEGEIVPCDNEFATSSGSANSRYTMSELMSGVL